MRGKVLKRLENSAQAADDLEQAAGILEDLLRSDPKNESSRELLIRIIPDQLTPG